MEFKLEDAVEVLQRTPRVVDAILRGQSESWLNSRKGDGTFSATDVVGHLIFGEMTDWIPRARQILEGRGDQPFEPFDRSGHAALIKNRSIEELLDQFAELRKSNLDDLASLGLDEQRLAMQGTHPELGTVTLRNLLATWVVHDLGHIAQIMRVMSSQYGDEVGPWRAYLSIVS